jgi:DNA-binding NarL/FixJ family response regulator
MGERPRIILADDHELSLDGVKRILRDKFDVVASVHDGLSLLDAVARLSPDVVIADITMPGCTGLEATGELKRRQCHVPIVILTVNNDPDVAREAFTAGASGYVVKAYMVYELETAINEALHGRPFISAGVQYDA